MGKGGNSTQAFNGATIKNVSAADLNLERKEKVAKAPQFYWNEGGNTEEPHVARYVPNLF